MKISTKWLHYKTDVMTGYQCWLLLSVASISIPDSQTFVTGLEALKLLDGILAHVKEIF